MKAEEMFKELGYEKSSFEDFIRYTNDQVEQNIEFCNDKHIAIYNTCYNKPDDIEMIFLDEIKAINKQIEELGWNNEIK